MNIHSINGFAALDQEVPTITGYKIALGKHDATDLALIAAELFLERRRLIKPRVAQLSRMCPVNSIYITAAIAILSSGDADLEAAVRCKRMPLLEGAVLAKHPRPNLVETFFAADANERVDLGRIAGVDTVFDSVISPLI